MLMSEMTSQECRDLVARLGFRQARLCSPKPALHYPDLLRL